MSNIRSPVAKAAPGFEVRHTDTGTIRRKDMQTRPQNGLFAQNPRLEPGRRGAMKIEDRNSVWRSIFSISKVSAIRQSNALDSIQQEFPYCGPNSMEFYRL